jgi:hypothetical protein
MSGVLPGHTHATYCPTRSSGGGVFVRETVLKKNRGEQAQRSCLTLWIDDRRVTGAQKKALCRSTGRISQQVTVSLEQRSCLTFHPRPPKGP